MRYRLYILITAFLFSTGGAAIKATSLNGWQTSALRSGIAAATLFLLLPATRRNWTWPAFAIAAAYAAALTLFALANKLTTGANAIFLQSGGPLYLLLLGPLLLGEKVRRAQAVWIPLFAAGLGLVLFSAAAPSATAADPVKGNLFAVLSGLAYALVLVGFRWMGRRGVNGGITATALGNLTAFAVCLPFSISGFAPTPADWVLVLYLGIVQVGLAYWLLTRAMSHVTALESSLLILLEPALNPVWNAIVHHERPGALAIAGGCVILAATGGVVLSARRPVPPPPAP